MYWEINHQGNCITDAETGEFICSLNGTRIGYAKRIAANPDLIRVLTQVQMLLETAERVHPSVNGDGPSRVVIEEKFWRYWLGEIIKVLAKAEGK